MRVEAAVLFVIIAFVMMGSSGCSGSFSGTVLAAAPVGKSPGADDWEKAVPLDLEVMRGYIHQSPEVVLLDSGTSHRSTAECHHGAERSRPVLVRLMALYTPEDLYIKARWVDMTPDRGPEVISRGVEETSAPVSDDGLALIWGLSGDRSFNCASACHTRDSGIFDGGTRRRMEMTFSGEGALDLWRFRSGLALESGLADDMFVDGNGKKGDREQITSVRAGLTPGEVTDVKDVETDTPYTAYISPKGAQADVSVTASWDHGVWNVVFRRRLDSADVRDRRFFVNGRYPFGVAVFDGTVTEHHVADAGLELVLAEPADNEQEGKGLINEPLDF